MIPGAVDIVEREVELGDRRRARIFCRARSDWPGPAGLSDQDVNAVFADKEDAERLALVRLTLKKDFVRIDAHEGIDPADVWGLYLHADDGRLFLTKMIPRARVARMLETAPVVVETATMQVCESETPDDLKVAFDRWLARVVPDVPSPFYELNVGDDATAEGSSDTWRDTVDVSVAEAARRLPRQASNAHVVGP